jgi:glycogen(starch) synthase
MRVLMLGWEFPPYISGGLGMACYGLTKGLSQLGTEITFVLPHGVISTNQFGDSSSSFRANKEYELKDFPGMRFLPVGVQLYPYAKSGSHASPVGTLTGSTQAPHSESFASMGAGHYAGDLFQQVHKYSKIVQDTARHEQFDVIHAHDWMTFPAAIAVADMTGKPLVVHIHSTEHDRCGDGMSDKIYSIERRGMHRADKVIVVSGYTQKICMDYYGIDRRKCQIVYNAASASSPYHWQANQKDEKVVLFLGRMTMQKGPEYFIAAARKVLDVMDNVKFIMAGTGDMFHRMVNYAAELGIGHKVLFAGFLKEPQVAQAFQMADLYVMPSVSEPFGIAPLEALTYNVPVMISKQAGVGEVLTHVLKVDFWDVDEMANKMAAVLKYPALPKTLRQHAVAELEKFDWTESARKCMAVYNTVRKMAS